MFESAKSLIAILDKLHTALDVTSAMLTLSGEAHRDLLAISGTLLFPEHAGRLPLSHSICRHVAGMAFPLVIDDAYTHPLTRGTPAVTDLGVAAYLGVPVENAAAGPGHVLGAMATRQRRWSESDLALAFEAARAVGRLL